MYMLDFQPLLSYLWKFNLREFQLTRIYQGIKGECEIKDSIKDRICEAGEDWDAEDLVASIQLGRICTPLLKEWCKKLGVDIDEMSQGSIQLTIQGDEAHLRIKMNDIEKLF
jgi:hypothetical protein